MEYKSNHYVAKHYQNKWGKTLESGKSTITYLIIKSGKIMQDISKNIAQKNNLYTFPNEFSSNDNKINEKFLVKIFEDWYCDIMKNSLDNNIEPSRTESHKLGGFVIVQSFRTLKFKQLNEKIISTNINFKDKPNWQKDFSLHLSYLIIKGFPELIRNAEINFFRAPENFRFITSDNPASYYIKENNAYTLVNEIACNTEIVSNPNLRIICPLNPFWCAEVMLFQNENKIPSEINRNCRTITVDEFEVFQDLIYKGANNIIIGCNENDLEKVYKKLSQ